MTYSGDRLGRIEQLLAENAKQLIETRKITDSNARAIAAWSSRGTAAEEVSSPMAANTSQRMEKAIADTMQMIANLGRQRQETNQRFEIYLQDSKADRQRAEQQHQEWQERFDSQMAEIRAGREANNTEHRAFIQNVKVLLAEIDRVSQRLAD